jgi:hypothetical protein
MDSCLPYLEWEFNPLKVCRPIGNGDRYSWLTACFDLEEAHLDTSKVQMKSQ